MIPQVNQYLIDGCGRCSLYKTPNCKVDKWINELKLLREIVSGAELKEDSQLEKAFQALTPGRQ